LREEGSGAKARQVLELARAVRPDDAGLWEMTVKLAPTLAAQEQAYADMTQRFPGQQQYAVRLGAVRVKLGDHAGARRVLEPLVREGSEAIKAEALVELARSELAQQHARQALVFLLAANAAGVEP